VVAMESNGRPESNLARVHHRLAVLWTSRVVPQNGRRFGALCHGPVASLAVGGFDAQLAPLTEWAPLF
jgi:hypothetical protein